MRVLLQRVTQAQVSVDGEVIGKIASGLLLFVGVTHSDDDSIAVGLATKVANLRIFEDERGLMNLSALDLHTTSPGSAAMLVVSQFTLYADTRKGRRPSFIEAASPNNAAMLIERFVGTLSALGLPVETGQFGAEMQVELINDGPVTIWLDSNEIAK